MILIISVLLFVEHTVQQTIPPLPTSWTKSASNLPKEYLCYVKCIRKCILDEKQENISKVPNLESHCKWKCRSYDPDAHCNTLDNLCQLKCNGQFDAQLDLSTSPLHSTPENLTVDYARFPQPTPHEADLIWKRAPNAMFYVTKYLDITDEILSRPNLNVTTENNFHFIKPTLCSVYAFAVAAVYEEGISIFSETVILDVPKPIVPSPSYNIISVERINESFSMNLDEPFNRDYNSTVVVRIGFSPPPNWNLTDEITRIDANVHPLDAGTPRLSFATNPIRVGNLAEFEVRLPGVVADTLTYFKFMFTVEKMFTKCDDQNAVFYPYAYNTALNQTKPGLIVQINCKDIKNSWCKNYVPAPIPSCGYKDVILEVMHTDGSETANVLVSFIPRQDPYANRQILWYNITYGEGIKANNLTETTIYNLTKIVNTITIMNDTHNFTLSNLHVGKVYVVYICNVYNFHYQNIVGDWNDIQRYPIDLLNYKNKSPPTSSYDFHLLITILIPVLVVILITALIIVLCIMRKCRNGRIIDQYGSGGGIDQDGRYVILRKKYDHWEIPRRRLQIDESNKLGSGAFGAVYKGRIVGTLVKQRNSTSVLAENWMQAENCEVAVKMLPAYADDISKSEFQSEINLMKQLGYHERLVNMLACVTADDPLCLIVEYCSDGDLLNYLRKRRNYMIELQEKGIDVNNATEKEDVDFSMVLCKKDLISFAWQICVGLEYLSERGYIHRDVAARNVLVASGKRAKIGDFGLCRYSCSDPVYLSKGGRLPIKWMAIEAIKHYEFTTKSDVWSYGVLLFEIVTLGGSPYPGVQPQDMEAFLDSGQRMEQPEACPFELYEVMLDCWRVDPEKRPTFSCLREGMRMMLEHITEDYYYVGLNQSRDYYNHFHQQDEFVDPDPTLTNCRHSVSEQNQPPSPTDTISIDENGDNVFDTPPSPCILNDQQISELSSKSDVELQEAPGTVLPLKEASAAITIATSQASTVPTSTAEDTVPTSPASSTVPPLPPRLKPKRLNSVGGESVSSVDESMCTSPAFIVRRHESTSSEQGLLSPAYFGEKHNNFPKFFKFTPSTKLSPLPELPSIATRNLNENYLSTK